tara:strand:- start:2804 stop:4669 length:1866 start_codon:yes stop_codon:yes gene_type:complete
MGATKTSEKAVPAETHAVTECQAIVIRFAGDSGDGMQTVGDQFTASSVVAGNDISTFPDFPAEIRAPAGTLPGISGFQIQFGSTEILTPGDAPDALVAMNPAALKGNIADLNEQGLLIINIGAFTPENLKKAGYDVDPLEDKTLYTRFRVTKVDINQLTLDALQDVELKSVGKMRCRNFFALGMTYWIYDRAMDTTLKWIETKWGRLPAVAEGAEKTLKAGYYFGETAEIELPRYRVERAPIEAGVYRKISGNEALILGLVAASEVSWQNMVFASYPITPASAILEGLAQLKNYGIKTMQAEDEIAAIGAAIGASFAGGLGVTATSGPGMCLKSEFLGLAIITELPLVVIDVQRGGPSTGLPTKTEQGDLLQCMFGRNSDSPVPIIAARSPSDCFDVAIEAVRIALRYNTPVVLLSDGYIANSAEPWRVPSVKSLPNLVDPPADPGDEFMIYKRDPDTLARQVIHPGRRGYEHQIGGLEKNERGQVSYDPENHERMTRLRAGKVNGIARSYPKTEILGDDSGKLLFVGWGGTYGAITVATQRLRAAGQSVSSIHLRYLNPLPLDLVDILSRFDKIVVPEMNLGHLTLLLRAKYLVDAVQIQKIQGRPFTVTEIVEAAKEML